MTVEKGEATTLDSCVARALIAVRLSAGIANENDTIFLVQPMRTNSCSCNVYNNNTIHQPAIPGNPVHCQKMLQTTVFCPVRRALFVVSCVCIACSTLPPQAASRILPPFTLTQKSPRQ